MIQRVLVLSLTGSNMQDLSQQGDSAKEAPLPMTDSTEKEISGLVLLETKRVKLSSRIKLSGSSKLEGDTINLHTHRFTGKCI